MEEFQIIQPSPHLAPYIKNYWLLKTDVTSPAIVRTLPTGMMSMVFHRGTRILSVKEMELHPRAFLSGHEKSFADLEYNGQINMISAPLSRQESEHFSISRLTKPTVSASQQRSWRTESSES